MKITDVKCHLLTCKQRFAPGGPEYTSSSAMVRIETDEGIDGLGEPLSGYHAPECVPEIVNFYRTELLGQDPLRIGQLWRKMYNASLFWGRGGLGLSVISALDNALWDMSAKAQGVPLYQLLGGLQSDKIRVYATGASCLSPLERMAEIVQGYVAEGFTAFKVGTGYADQPYGSLPFYKTVAQETKKLAVLREAVGPDIDIIIDGHQGAVSLPWSGKAALQIAREMEPHRILFFEEPLPYDDPEGYAFLRNETATPIAGGESLHGLYDFENYFRLGALDIAQPDVGYSGGISEVLKIVAAAESRGVRVVLHNPSLGAGMMAGLHVAFARHACNFIELLPVRTELQKALMVEPLRFEAGYLLPPSAPGAGMQWRDDIPKQFPFVPGSGERQGEG